MNKKIIIGNCIVLVVVIVNIFAGSYFFKETNTEFIYKKNILKVVEIKTTNDDITYGYATGFFIDSNGKILTNKHVVYDSTSDSNYKKIQVRLADELFSFFPLQKFLIFFV